MVNEVDGALQLYGTLRIWGGIVLGTIGAIVCVAVFVLSFTMQRGFDKVEATVDKVSCGGPQEVSKCTGGNRSGTRTCTSSTNVKCDLTVRFEAASKEHTAAVTKTYDQDHAPHKGASIDVWVHSTDPSDVRTSVLTPNNRLMMRIGSSIGFVVMVVGVAINVVLRNSQDYKRVQGALGAIGAVGDTL